ncbi:hypothetical protein [Agaribacterium haliotis]|uniref:hypothetical protein n=1 Tax=Agaribacterium haliotis TaxID=2013869 RepID=UPI000BB59576|nr:hypothetical protein [Agaribacterium haliotis]
MIKPSAPSVADSMVASGEALFKQGRMIRPEQDNAYLRYRAALIMEPDNEAARSGLQAIALAEVEQLRQSLAAGKLTYTGRQLKQLEALFPDNAVLSDFSRQFKQAQAKAYAKRRTQQASVKADANTIVLNKKDLSARNDSIKAQLSELARKIEKSQEGLMIYARSDAEGRWIYQQMREAVPDYRIRGDIRIGQPSLRLLAPYE